MKLSKGNVAELFGIVIVGLSGGVVFSNLAKKELIKIFGEAEKMGLSIPGGTELDVHDLGCAMISAALLTFLFRYGVIDNKISDFFSGNKKNEPLDADMINESIDE